MAELKALYTDLDGTLLGPGGSLFAAPGGGTTDRAAEALRAIHEAGVLLVVMTGRTRRSAEVGRALGAQAYIGEMGGILVERFVPELEVVRNLGAFPGDGSPVEAMTRQGAAAMLLERYAGRLRPVAPGTEVGLIFHGLVDAGEATGSLSDAGFDWLVLHDNGRLRRTYDDLDVSEVRSYHLLPRGVTKASAVRLHRERHGIDPGEAAAVGDSTADLIVAPEVGRFFLVANGVPTLEEGIELPGNVTVTEGARGEGFAEAVDALLSGRPAPRR
jgi:hydroxymethylpyrimidine pyrophosphatase-like HAD family hydrolase